MTVSSSLSGKAVRRAAEVHRVSFRLHWHSALVLLLLSVPFGCSPPPKQLGEELNWGQTTPPRGFRRPSASESRQEPAGNPRTVESDDTGQRREGIADNRADIEGDSSDGNSSGKPNDVPPESEVEAGKDAGAGRDGPGGESDSTPPVEAKRPAPALPGREHVRPKLSASAAAASAKQLLKRAQQLFSANDQAAAADAAIEAYDQVFPHAQSDAECRTLCKQLEGLLNAAGRRKGRSEPVPTRFE